MYVLGNEEVLERILNNLISNGITYGGEGKVIGITLECDNESVTVDDHGIEVRELVNIILIRYLKGCIHLKIHRNKFLSR